MRAATAALAVLAWAAAPVRAQLPAVFGETPERTAERLVETRDSLWRAGDLGSIAMLHAPDVVLRATEGYWETGRPAILARLTREAEAPDTSATRRGRVLAVRLVRDDLLLVDEEVVVTVPDPLDGEPRARSRTLASWLLERRGTGWVVRDVRLAALRPDARPPRPLP